MPTVVETRHSVCAQCQQPISISITEGQRWSDAEWVHEHHMDHRADPEIRFLIDATCPGCGHPEIGFAPAREEFVCSRCQHTQTTRPEA